MTSFAYYPLTGGAHVHVSVYVGPDEHHRARCGTLVFTPQEWDDFAQWVAGPEHVIYAAPTPA